METLTREFRELLMEARDNCKASIAEDGISDHRRQYRRDLLERLDAALDSQTHEWVHACNLWVDPTTSMYVVDHLDHPPHECIKAFISRRRTGEQT